ncbi:hypothetical protein OC844_000483 [Tilletia horrida]|nr:hypothetical protein OC844_000483 [Tilletia horrida]
MERFTHDARSTFLLSNLVGTVSGGTSLDPTSYIIASHYKPPVAPGPASAATTNAASKTALGKRKADQADGDTDAGCWTVFAGDAERGSGWMGKWTGDDLSQLAKRDRSWHDFATRVAEAWSAGRITALAESSGSLKLEFDHRGAHTVVIELKPVSIEHAAVIGMSVAHALGRVQQGRMLTSMPSTPRSHGLGSSVPKSNYSPSSASSWDAASQATLILSQVPENASVEQFKNAILKRDKKIAKLKHENAELRRELKKERSHKRDLLATEKQRDSQASAKLTGGKTLGRTGFVPRDMTGPGEFGAGSSGSETEQESDDGPSSSPTEVAASAKKRKKT